MSTFPGKDDDQLICDVIDLRVYILYSGYPGYILLIPHPTGSFGKVTYPLLTSVFLSENVDSHIKYNLVLKVYNKIMYIKLITMCPAHRSALNIHCLKLLLLLSILSFCFYMGIFNTYFTLKKFYISHLHWFYILKMYFTTEVLGIMEQSLGNTNNKPKRLNFLLFEIRLGCKQKEL